MIEGSDGRAGCQGDQGLEIDRCVVGCPADSPEVYGVDRVLTPPPAVRQRAAGCENQKHDSRQ